MYRGKFTTIVLDNGDLISENEKIWCVCCSTTEKSPGQALNSNTNWRNDALCIYRISLDEEHVFLEIDLKNKILDLGERVHHYLLATLARRKIADAVKGVDKDNQGWVDMDELSSMLRLENSHLNIQIYRARKQLAAALGGQNVIPEIIERRHRGLRFGDWNVRICRGSNIEGELNNQTAFQKQS